MNPYINIAPRERQTSIFQKISEYIAQKDNKNFFQSFALSLAQELNVFCILIGYFHTNKTIITTLSFVLNHEIQENFEYDYSDYPCLEVFQSQKNFLCKNLLSKYPNALHFHQIQSSHYLGVPILRKNGDSLGIVIFLTHHEKDFSACKSVVNHFAQKIGFEIETILEQNAQKEHKDALEVSNSELQQTLLEQSQKLETTSQLLSKANEKLIQQDKMATLGILSAGIAHEINNPLNYILSSIEGIQILFQDYKEILKELELKFDNSGETKIYWEEQIQIKCKEIQEDFDVLYQNAKRGVQKVSSLVKSLKEYSHPSEENFEKANLHHLIQNAVDILQHEFKGNINLELQLDSNIPDITCIPNKLIQVFVNLIQNAIQVEKKGQVGKINIKTLLTQDFQSKRPMVNIKIIDNGIGIRQENIDKLFQPFFTTKPVGKGVGLGLFISYGIIEKHGGILSVESKEMEGTCFTIELPIK